MTDTLLMSTLELKTQDELSADIAALVNENNTVKKPRWSRVKSVKSKVTSGATTVRSGISDVYTSAKERTLKFWNNHPTFQIAMTTGVAFSISFGVTLFLVTGILILYVLTLNWMDVLIG